MLKKKLQSTLEVSRIPKMYASWKLTFVEGYRLTSERHGETPVVVRTTGSSYFTPLNVFANGKQSPTALSRIIIGPDDKKNIQLAVSDSLSLCYCRIVLFATAAAWAHGRDVTLRSHARRSASCSAPFWQSSMMLV